MTKHGVVKEFTGEYAFLSNFHVNPFAWRNTVFPTGEHAFQYAKGYAVVDHMEAHRHFDAVLAAPSPSKAKYAGRSVKIDVGAWDDMKIQYMREIVHARFATSEVSMVGSLINTGAMMLVEGNTWGDGFWGRCAGKGFNTLGVILMEERGYWLRSDFK
jgi:ribA/ribD-fused uncharacterized protein